MDMWLHFCLLVYCTNLVVGSSLFPPSREVQFKYYADMRAGSEFPTPASSQFSLRGLLKVQAIGDKAVLQLADISTSLYNGAGTQSDEHWANGSPLPTQAAELYHPFTIHSKDGAVIGISGVDGEGEWSVNIKRALASLMQLEISKLETPTFVAKENGLYGYCDVECSVKHLNETYVVHKNMDHSSCKGFPASSWSNVSPIPPFCTLGQDDFLTSSSERVYTLNANKNIISIVARGATYSQPKRAKGELQFILVDQRLVHEAEDSVATPAVPSTGPLTDLIYHVPGNDVSQGRSPISQSWLLSTSKTLLAAIGASLEEEPSRNKEDFHISLVYDLIHYMKFMEKSSLAQFFDELVGTSYQQEVLRKLFLESLPKVGTTDATLFIRDLIIERSIVDATEAARLISQLPFYIREPNEALLRECEVLSTLPDEYGDFLQRSGVLSFATLVFKTCKHHCTPETQEIYVRKYFERFTEATDYDNKMLYLNGLSNLEDGKVFEYLEKVVKEDPNGHSRFLAVWATLNVAIYHPQQVYDLYWPILANVKESLEMRVAALTMLMISKPTSGRFFGLHWFMTSEKDPRLKHFYYTSLQSLANTKDPCYSLMKPFASQVLRLLPPPSLRLWTTGNYILDYSSDLHGFGAMTHLFLIGDSSTDLPNVFFLQISSFALGIHSNPLSIYLKLTGVAHIVKERLLHIDPNSVTVPQLAEILHKMKAEPSSSDEVHVEMIIKSEDRIVSYLHLNRTTLHLVADALSQLYEVNFKRHYNMQHMDTAMIYERILPTDLGIPAAMEFSVKSLMSFRGAHTQEVTGSHILTEGQLELRQMAYVMGNLAFYNPLIDLWHGTQQSTAIKMVLPFDGKLNVDTDHKSIKFNIVRKPDSYIGILTHMQTDVFVWGEDNSKKQLNHHCPSCLETFIITKGDKYKRTEKIFDLGLKDLGIEVRGDIFDCEHHTFLQTLESAMTHQNYHVYPPSRPFVKLAYVLDAMFMAAPTGTCGSEIRLMNIENRATELEGLIQLSSLGTKTSLAVSLIHKSDESILHEWKSNLDCQKDDEYYHISLDLMRNAPSVAGSRKLCLNSVIQIPTAPTNKLLIKPSKPVIADIKMNWAAVGGHETCGGEPADTLPFNLRIVAETMPEQQELAQAANTWPFNACKNGNDTVACHHAAHEMATLRKYSVSLNFTKPIDPEVLFFARTSDGQLAVSAEVSLIDPVIYVTLGSERNRLDNTRHWMDHFLLNTHYPALYQIAQKMGLIKPDL